jgi:hypothetical protein
MKEGSNSPHQVKAISEGIKNYLVKELENEMI